MVVCVQEGDHEVVSQAIRDSQVLLTKDNINWDWHLITSLLKVLQVHLEYFGFNQTNQVVYVDVVYMAFIATLVVFWNIFNVSISTSDFSCYTYLIMCWFLCTVAR